VPAFGGEKADWRLQRSLTVFKDASILSWDAPTHPSMASMNSSSLSLEQGYQDPSFSFLHHQHKVIDDVLIARGLAARSVPGAVQECSKSHRTVIGIVRMPDGFRQDAV